MQTVHSLRYLVLVALCLKESLGRGACSSPTNVETGQGDVR